MASKLVIVESPAKARTLQKILGPSFLLKASLGHVRDLPKSTLGVDIENDFAPKYVIPKAKLAIVQEIKKAAAKAATIFLATDPDREGEAIAWHLAEAAAMDRSRIRRVVFHEITDEAVKQAFQHPRDVDMNLVDAQQARRILDRLVGYQISPLLWRKVAKGLSAGRVQTAALRMVVDREREVRGFVRQEYWTIEVELAGESGQAFRVNLFSLTDGTRAEIADKAAADLHASELERAAYKVSKVTRKDVSRNPSPPFITSTMQQEAWRHMRFSAEHTMSVAQQLYEGLPVGEEGAVGLITYMRTDSPHVAASAVTETREFIRAKYGDEFLHATRRNFTSRSKMAQEAHEAIRPTSVAREPDRIKTYLDRDQFRLYELIWKRMVATQMASAVFDTSTVEVAAQPVQGKAPYLLRATTSTLKFPGFLTLYREGKDEAEEEERVQPALAALHQGAPLKYLGVYPEQRFTEPLPRYTEATLIKIMEQKGIGRPSTYAPIISTIQKRDYVIKKQGRFYAEDIGMIVSDLMVKHFPDIFDLSFTALMEDKLDEIARGEQPWVGAFKSFYGPFSEAVQKATSTMEKVKFVEEAPGEICPQCGKPMVIRMGRFGKFLACSAYPECKTTKPWMTKTGLRCPECGGNIVERRSKKKKIFYGCANYPNCKFVTSRKPLAQPCPVCGSLLLPAGRDKAKCWRGDYDGPVPSAEPELAAAKS
ncbi:MAG: type I DNA topoisomerase [Dehalococcoidia bacterium]|nr:type I DNA topoisomerase [Dehalococcoidia bacterium]